MGPAGTQASKQRNANREPGKVVSIIFECKTCPIHGLERSDYLL
jgi:hypothetical protein